MAYEPKKFSPAELTELHALPDDSLLTAQEAAAFLRLKYGTLAWYRCLGGGPEFTRFGPKLTRYKLGYLRDYAVSRWEKASGAPRRRCSPPAPPTRRVDRCAHENAHGVRDRGRKGTADQESELSTTHGTTHGINDAAGHAAATPSFEAAAEYRRARLDLIPLRRRDKMPADRRWQERAYDHAEVLERARHDGLNLGVRLPAEVVFVDVDSAQLPGWARQPGRLGRGLRPAAHGGAARPDRQPVPPRPPLLLP